MAAEEHEHPKAAPGELDRIRQFVNTRDLETDEDKVAEPAALAAWLAERDLLPAGTKLSGADVRTAQSLREALRELLLAHNGVPVEPAACVDTVNDAAKRAELIVSFDVDGAAELVPARPGIDAALGRLLAIVFRAQTDGTWQRLKACGDHGCEWAFYDWSKNRSGTWCDMAVCGNRAKARAYRDRRSGSGRRPT